MITASAEPSLRARLKTEGQSSQSEGGRGVIIILGSNYFYFLGGEMLYNFNLFLKLFDLLPFL